MFVQAHGGDEGTSGQQVPGGAAGAAAHAG